MKKLLFALTLFISFQTFSQEIKYENGKFFIKNTKLSNKEVKEILSSNNLAFQKFQASKEKSSIGGFLLGFGGGLVLSDLIIGSNKYNYKYPGTSTYIGLGAIAVSIPILTGRKKKMEEAISIYNSDLKSNGFEENFQLDFVSNQNGFGLKLSF